MLSARFTPSTSSRSPCCPRSQPARSAVLPDAPRAKRSAAIESMIVGARCRSMGSLSSTLKSATTKPSRVTHFRARASSDNALSAGGKEIERERGVKRAERGFDLEGFFFTVSQKKENRKIENQKPTSRPRPPPPPLGLHPRRRPSGRGPVPLQRRQDLPGRGDRADGCGARLEARDAR